MILGTIDQSGFYWCISFTVMRGIDEYLEGEVLKLKLRTLLNVNMKVKVNAGAIRSARGVKVQGIKVPWRN